MTTGKTRGLCGLFFVKENSRRERFHVENAHSRGLKRRFRGADDLGAVDDFVFERLWRRGGQQQADGPEAGGSGLLNEWTGSMRPIVRLATETSRRTVGGVIGKASCELPSNGAV